MPTGAGWQRERGASGDAAAWSRKLSHQHGVSVVLTGNGEDRGSVHGSSAFLCRVTHACTNTDIIFLSIHTEREPQTNPSGFLCKGRSTGTDGEGKPTHSTRAGASPNTERGPVWTEVRLTAAAEPLRTQTDRAKPVAPWTSHLLLATNRSLSE